VIGSLGWVLANAAEEGRNIVLSMLVVGLIFLAVIAIGDLAHLSAARRRAQRSKRPL
jgi:predicted membrane protein